MILSNRVFLNTLIIFASHAVVDLAHVLGAFQSSEKQQDLIIDDKRAVPSASEIRKAIKTVKDLYGKELVSRDDKKVLDAAKIMVKDARETTDNWSVRFVMLETAKNVFLTKIVPEDFQTVLELITNDFQVNHSAEIVKGISQMSKSVRNAADAKEIIEFSKEWVSGFTNTKKFESAKKISGFIQGLARKLRDKELIDESKEIRNRIIKLEKLAQEYSSALKAIEKNSTDEEAHLAIAKYFAIFENNDPEAIEHFEQSNDEKIQMALKAEKSGDEIAAAQHWLSLGKSNYLDLKQFCFRKSRQLFAKKQETSTGLDRRVCIRAIEELDKLMNFTPEVSEPTLDFKDGTILVLRIKTTSRKMILAYDPGATNKYAVVVDADSDTIQLNHAAEVYVDGKKQTDVRKNVLHRLIADGSEHEVKIKMGKGFEAWTSIKFDSKYNLQTTNEWVLTNGFIRLIRTE